MLSNVILVTRIFSYFGTDEYISLSPSVDEMSLSPISVIFPDSIGFVSFEESFGTSALTVESLIVTLSPLIAGTSFSPLTLIFASLMVTEPVASILPELSLPSPVIVTEPLSALIPPLITTSSVAVPSEALSI